jgi:uncharacterized metal-binding protein
MTIGREYPAVPGVPVGTPLQDGMYKNPSVAPVVSPNPPALIITDLLEYTFSVYSLVIVVCALKPISCPEVSNVYPRKFVKCIPVKSTSMFP